MQSKTSLGSSREVVQGCGVSFANYLCLVPLIVGQNFCATHATTIQTGPKVCPRGHRTQLVLYWLLLPCQWPHWDFVATGQGSGVWIHTGTKIWTCEERFALLWTPEIRHVSEWDLHSRIVLVRSLVELIELVSVYFICCTVASDIYWLQTLVVLNTVVQSGGHGAWPWPASAVALKK